MIPFAEPLFSSQDVDDIARRLPLDVIRPTAKSLETRNAHVLAWALHDAFGSAAFLSPTVFAPRALETASKDVENAAIRLFKSLGYSEDDLESIAEYGTGFEVSMELGSRRSPLHDEIMEQYLSSDDELVQDAAKWMRSSRESIASLYRAAKLVRESVASEPKGTTRRPSKGTGYLFERLAGIYFATFGIPPGLDSDRTNERAPAHLWARGVIDLAVAKLPEFRDGDRSAEAIRNMEALQATLSRIKTHVALAERMRDGWTEWLALPDNERWPPHVWHLTGVPQSGLVPDWVETPPNRAP